MDIQIQQQPPAPPKNIDSGAASMQTEAKLTPSWNNLCWEADEK